MSNAKHSCGLDTASTCTACEAKRPAKVGTQQDIIPDLGPFVDWVWALKAEREALRQIISDCATSCGATIPADCSLDYMAHLPVEVFSVISQMRAFANELINASYEGGSFDGCDIQDIAVRHGLLRIEQREEECGEVCVCREYGFPIDCYRKTALLGSAYTSNNDAATQSADTENVSRHEGGQT